MKKRIWELDALRGLFLLGVIVIHLIFDLEYLYDLVDWEYPAIFNFIQNWGGVLFLLISGICVTLGSHHIRGGLFVLGAGLTLTAVTLCLAYFGLTDGSVVIWFGVLHCLGLCMLLWAPLKNAKLPLLALLAAAAIAGGFWLMAQPPVDFAYLVPLGLICRGFYSADYFPLLPHFGFFLVGTILGKTLYRKGQSLLPKVNENFFLIRFLRFCGKHSLWIYLLHQPVLAGICWLLTLTALGG